MLPIVLTKAGATGVTTPAMLVVCDASRLGPTFELRRDRREGARPGLWRMYLATGRAWWLAVGPRLDRGVRPHSFERGPR